MDKELLDSPVARDCIGVAQAFVVEQGWADEASVQEWRQQAKAQVEDTLQQVQREPAPDPAEEYWHSLASTHLIDPEYVE
jgi:TPP-dependent pyruvate/acetoin dehydrogenase alpha subunit